MVERLVYTQDVVGSTPAVPTKGAILALLLAFSGCASHQVANPEKCKELIVAEELAEYAKLCETLRLARTIAQKKEWIDQIDASLKKCEYVFGKTGS